MNSLLLVCPGKRSGFSLLEMLVVLALLGLMVAVVLPSVVGPVERATRQFELDLLFQELGSLGQIARQHGRSFALDRLPDPAVQPYFVDFPDGWGVEFSPPLLVSPNGTCSESSARAIYGRGTKQIVVPMRLKSLRCEVSIDAEKN